MSIPPDPSHHRSSFPDSRKGEPTDRHKPVIGTKRKVSVEQRESSSSTPKHFHPDISGLTEDFSGDAVYFIEDDTQRQQVLESCRHTGSGPVIMLRSPADLDHHNLTSTLICREDGRVHQAPGRLLAEQPFTLVLDLTVMSPGQIASLNDLLAQPRYFLGEPLKDSVRLVALVSPSMLEPGPGKPGPDCWRRLLAFPTLYPASTPAGKRLMKKNAVVKSDEVLLAERVQMLADAASLAGQSGDSATKTIDFTDGDAWRTRLFGGLTLNAEGKLCFRAGQLAGLDEYQPVILRDAPWDNPDFTTALTTAMREGGFEANGSWVTLPDSLRWFRKDSSPEEIALLRQQFVQKKRSPLSPARGVTPDSAVYLNPVSLADALCDTQIHNGAIYSSDTLKQLLSGCQTLCLTEPLTDVQWLRLLRRLERLDNPPDLIDLTREARGFKPVLQPDIQCQVYPHEALPKLGKTHKTWRITAQTQWSSLWQNTQLASQNELRFEVHDTPLLKALKEGEPVAFYGLETCPELMARLESLLAYPPYLFINGQKVLLPRAKVTFLWPEWATQPKSPLWKNALAQGVLLSPPASEPHPMMELLENLPPSTQKRYPAKPPWQGEDFNALLTRQVEQEVLEDGAKAKLPVHYRKALHSLLIKAYRGDDEMYGYLKCRVRELHPDVPPETAANRDALKQWLGQHPVIDRRLLERHFWSLIRHCPVSSFSELLPDGFNKPDKAALDRLACYLVGAAEPGQRKVLARCLMVNLRASSALRYYQGARRSRLRDALLAAGGRRKSSEAVSEQARSLDQRIGLIVENNPDQKQAIDSTAAALKGYFPEELLQGDFRDLAQALVLGSRGQRDRQQRRIRRLAGRVQQHPLVFLQGEAGAGKSHMARVVAEQLRQGAGQERTPPPEVLSLGPETSAGKLFGQADIHKDISGDASSTFEPGPVLRWAMSDNPPLLVLDEANLAREGVLAPLAGLLETPPRISYQGQDYQLSDRHRVILTGNPEHYDGRHMDSTLKKHMLTLYYRPLDQDMLAESIIQPALPTHWSDSLKDQGTRAILSLYRQYAGLLPDALSPRDLQDVLCRINQTLRHHQQGLATADGTDAVETGDLTADPSPEALHQVVFDAFSDSLGGRVPADDHNRFHALGQWYKAHFPCDSSLMESKKAAFQNFLEQLRKEKPKADLNSAPVVQLVQQYWQFLDLQQDQPRGRRSLLVEGPAGWGKDFILDCVLALWKQQLPASAPFVHINASPNQWDALEKAARTAMEKGQKLVISELNLLPSRFLEGLFNEVLTSGTAQPGFALFATVNPSSFGGREALSTALKSRCTQVRLAPLSEPDLRGLLSRRTNNLSLPGWLSTRYQSLSELLEQRHAPVQLGQDDLFRAADILNHTTQENWPGAFKTTFGLALQAAGLTMDALEQRLIDSVEPMKDGRGERREKLSLSLNKEQPEPLTIELLAPDADPAWDAGRHILYLPDTADEGALLDMARSILAFYQQPSTEPVVPGNLGGEITRPQHYNVIKTFAGDQFDTGDYRLELKQLVIRNGQLQEKSLPADQGGIENVELPGWPTARLTLTKSRQLGSGDYFLEREHWTPLPGLSARDQLVSLQCKPPLPIEVARGKETGQLLVRLGSQAAEPQAPVHMDFIIEPDQAALAPLHSKEPIQTVDGLCDPLLQEKLKEAVFSTKSRIHPPCQELQNIQKIPDKALQLNALAQWCQTFGDDHDVPGEGMSLLLNLIREKQGVCRHRAQVFQVLSQYFGVPARMVGNTAHRYVEVSPDSGVHWRKIDLGGGGTCESQKIPQKHPENIEVPEGVEVSGLVGSCSAQEDFLEQLQKLIDEGLKETWEEGAERQKWSELVNFLKGQFSGLSNDCEHRRETIYTFLKNILFSTIPENGYLTECLNLPWPEILTHWHCQIQAEREPEKRARMLKQLSEGSIQMIDDIQYQRSEGKMPDARYFELMKSCLPLIQQKVTPAIAVLDALESLASHKNQEAERLLEEYYQQLTRPQPWPAELKQAKQDRRNRVVTVSP